jgi:hypothetical protein
MEHQPRDYSELPDAGIEAILKFQLHPLTSYNGYASQLAIKTAYQDCEYGLVKRSRDQFCVYVADRLVLPTLHNRISEIAEGTLSLDVATRDYIRVNLGFRWLTMESGKAAFELERRLQRGEAECGKPLLNPL